jgi:hypothetical protein
MIRVELGEEVNRRGKWRWTCPRYGLAGISRQPLLDACREIKRMGGDTSVAVGLFREARSVPSSTCSVGWGAAHTVIEPDRGRIHFAKWQAKPMAMIKLTGGQNGNSS